MKLAQGNMYLAQGNRSGFLAPLGARRNFFLVPGVAQGRKLDELAQGEIYILNLFLVPFWRKERFKY